MSWSKGIIYGVRFIFIANAVYLAFDLNFLLIGLLLGSLGLTYVPEIFTKLTHVKMSMAARVVYSFFILGSQWLGTYLRLYDSILWWDILLHFSSGIILGYVGLLILLCADRENILKKKYKFSVIVIFVFLVSISGAVFWEIMEFLSDTFIGSNTQLGSLQDTMEDMIFGTLGALVFVAYLYITDYRKTESPLDKLIQINKNK